VSDARVRDLERRAACGDGRAGSALLVARLRRGALDRADLELRAWAGDPAALRAAAGIEPPGDLGPWVLGLQRFGASPCRRAALAAGRLALAAWESWEAGEFAPGAQIREALDAAAAAGDAPEDEERRGDAHEALAAAERALDGASSLLAYLEAEHGLALEAPWRAHQAGLATLSSVRAALASLETPEDLAGPLNSAAREVAQLLGDQATLQAMRSAALLGPAA
jgi:hypothetical protein